MALGAGIWLRVSVSRIWEGISFVNLGCLFVVLVDVCIFVIGLSRGA
jgi:hypothetical protein